MTEIQSEKKFEHGGQDVVVGWGVRQVHVVGRMSVSAYTPSA